MRHHITKAMREEMLARAQTLIAEVGFDDNTTVESHPDVTLSLIEEFDVQRRTALKIHRDALAGLRGATVDAWRMKNGLPRVERKARSFTLSDEEYQTLESLGAGNATEGIRVLLREHEGVMA